MAKDNLNPGLYLNRGNWVSNKKIPADLAGYFKDESGKAVSQFFQFHGKDEKAAISANKICQGNWEAQIRKARADNARGLTVDSVISLAFKARGAVAGDDRDSRLLEAVEALFASKGGATALRETFNPHPDRERPADVQKLVDIAEGKLTPLEGPLFAKFIANLEASGNTKLAEYRGAVSRFVAWLNASGVKPYFENVRKSVAADYFAYLIGVKGLKREGVKPHKSALSKYWQAAIEAELIPDANPWAGVMSHGDVAPMLKKAKANGDTGQRLPFEAAELEALFASSPDRAMTDSMAIALLTGMRPGEMFSLTVGDCANGFFHIRAGEIEAVDGSKRAKSLKNAGTTRLIPIPSALLATVARLCNREGVKPSDRLLIEGALDVKGDIGRTFSRRFSEHRNAVLPVNDRLTLYSMRHSLETGLRLAGVSTDTIALIGGQKVPGMVGERYANLKRLFEARTIGQAELAQLSALMLPALDSFPIPAAVAKAIGVSPAKARQAA